MTHTPPRRIRPNPPNSTKRKLQAFNSPLAHEKFKVRKVSNYPTVRDWLIDIQEGRCPGLMSTHGHAFRLCGSIYLTDCDHIIERRHHGADKRYNLQMLCRECHKVKTKWNRVSQRLL
jgi:5-methylcytosine-specific restriction endonuclease McrA